MLSARDMRHYRQFTECYRPHKKIAEKVNEFTETKYDSQSTSRNMVMISKKVNPHVGDRKKTAFQRNLEEDPLVLIT
jgi:hypothetical protein